MSYCYWRLCLMFWKLRYLAHMSLYHILKLQQSMYFKSFTYCFPTDGLFIVQTGVQWTLMCMLVYVLHWFVSRWASYKDVKKDNEWGDGHREEEFKGGSTEYSPSVSHRTSQKAETLIQKWQLHCKTDFLGIQGLLRKRFGWKPTLLRWFLPVLFLCKKDTSALQTEGCATGLGKGGGGVWWVGRTGPGPVLSLSNLSCPCSSLLGQSADHMCMVALRYVWEKKTFGTLAKSWKPAVSLTHAQYGITASDANKSPS